MAEQIKNVVFEFETRFNKSGSNELKKEFNSLDGAILKLERDLKKAFDELKKSGGNKNEIKKLSDEIKLFDKFTKELNKTLEKKNDLTEKETESITELTQATSKRTEAVTKEIKVEKEKNSTLTGFLGLLDNISPALGRYGFAISRAAQNMLGLVKAHNDGTVASTGFGRALSILKNPIVAVGASLAAVASISFAAFLKTSGEAADEASARIEGFKIGLESLAVGLGRLFSAGVSLFKGNIFEARNAFDDFTKSITGFNETVDKGTALGRESERLQDFTRELRLANSILEATIARNREIISEEAKSLGDISKKRIALSALRKDEIKLNENNLIIAQKEVDLIKNRLDLIKQNRDLTDPEADLLTNALIKLQEVERNSANLSRQINKQEKSINSQAAAILKERADILAQLDELNFQIRTNQNVNASGIVDPIGAENAVRAIRKAVLDLRAKTAELLKDTENEKDLIFAIDFEIDAEETIKKLTRQLEAVNQKLLAQPLNAKDSVSIKVPVTVVSGETGEQRALREQAEQKKKAEIRKEIEEQSLNTILSATETSKTILDIKVAQADKEIEIQQNKIDQLNELADLGNSEQIKLEKERLEELTNERDKFIKRQKALDAVEIAANLALTISRYVSGFAKQFAANPLLAIISGAAVLASVAAGVASITKLSRGFEEGTEFVTESNGKKPGKTDTIPVWVAEGERIVPTELNKKLNGISNTDLVDAVTRSRYSNSPIPSASHGFSGNQSNEISTLLKEQNELLKTNNKLMQDTKIDVQVGFENYKVEKRKAQKGEAIRKRLSRS